MYGYSDSTYKSAVEALCGDKRPRLPRSEFGAFPFNVKTAERKHLTTEAIRKLAEDGKLPWFQEYARRFFEAAEAFIQSGGRYGTIELSKTMTAMQLWVRENEFYFSAYVFKLRSNGAIKKELRDDIKIVSSQGINPVERFERMRAPHARDHLALVKK